MTRSPDSLRAEFQGPIWVSGNLCLVSMLLRQDFSDNASRQVFDALQRPRVPSHPLLLPVTALSATGKTRFNTQ